MEDLKIFLCSLETLYQTQYVSFSDLEKFKADMPNLPKGWKYRKITKTINYYLKHRQKLNQAFIRREQQKPYTVEGNYLDSEQIAAVVACEDAELILASAGSGKSASLIAKVDYLVNSLKIPAEEILVIAFTRKVVKELNERMGGSGVEICTFHSFGNKIIKNLNLDLKLVPDDFLEKTISKILTSWTKNQILSPNDLKDFGDEENFAKLLISTLQLMKNEQITLKEFKNRILTMKNQNEREKALKFYNYFARTVRIYGKILRDHKLYDYSDMLSWSTRIIKNLPKGELKYQYILFDEVQDLSLSKSLLLQAMLNNCESAKLFAVGDDWQSIYRFAGSNLGVLNDFEKTFQRTTYRGVIRRTYRFGQPTAWISEYFIRRNKSQSKKKVEVFKKTKTPIDVCFSTENPPNTPKDYNAINQYLEQLYKKYGDELFKKRIQIISRYNRDLFRLVLTKERKFQNARILEETEEGVTLKWFIDSANKSLDVAFCSMHKSKGITRDIVFVINMNEGDKGMPSTRTDDPILATMLAQPDRYPLAEERRLFYVAITRATELTVLVTERKKISRFIREIAKNLNSEIADSIL